VHQMAFDQNVNSKKQPGMKTSPTHRLVYSSELTPIAEGTRVTETMDEFELSVWDQVVFCAGTDQYCIVSVARDWNQ